MEKDSSRTGLSTIGSYYIQRKLLNMLSSLPKPPPPVAPHAARVEVPPPPVPARRSSHPCMSTSHHSGLMPQRAASTAQTSAKKHTPVMSRSASGAPASRLVHIAGSGVSAQNTSPSSPRRLAAISRAPALHMPTSPLISKRLMKSPLPVRHGLKPPLPTPGRSALHCLLCIVLRVSLIVLHFYVGNIALHYGCLNIELLRLSSVPVLFILADFVSTK